MIRENYFIIHLPYWCDYLKFDQCTRTFSTTRFMLHMYLLSSRYVGKIESPCWDKFTFVGSSSLFCSSWLSVCWASLFPKSETVSASHSLADPMLLELLLCFDLDLPNFDCLLFFAWPFISASFFKYCYRNTVTRPRSIFAYHGSIQRLKIKLQTKTELFSGSFLFCLVKVQTLLLRNVSKFAISYWLPKFGYLITVHLATD